MRYAEMLSSGVKTVAPKGASMLGGLLGSKDRKVSGVGRGAHFPRRRPMSISKRKGRGSAGISPGVTGLLAGALGGLGLAAGTPKKKNGLASEYLHRAKQFGSERIARLDVPRLRSEIMQWRETPRRERVRREERGGGGGVPQLLTAAMATAIGAGLMYLLDPARGRRRRSLIRDQAVHAWRVAETGARKTARDAASRARGLVAETRAMLREEEVSEERLCARVRAALGRAVSHPGSIHVDAYNGTVVLSGPVLSDEVDNLIATVRAVRGVREVENQLEPHDEPGDVPGLQGGKVRGRRGRSRDLARVRWSPPTRLAAGLGGGALVSYALIRRDLLGLALGVAGAGLAVRSLTNMPATRLLGIGAGRRRVVVQKTIHIDAPVDRVFEFWTRYENFPHFMSHVREVREVEGDLTHWVVSGPAGITLEWDAELTRYEPGRVLAWQSVEGSPIENEGVIRFEENEAGGTRVSVKLAYHPPGGTLGHLAAKLFGADPKSEMDQDLMRMKMMIETGNPPHDASQPVERREEAMPEMNVGPSRMPEPRGGMGEGGGGGGA